MGGAAMAADTCEACGVGTVVMDTVYGIMACDSCGRVFDDVETFLGAHHQAGHVMERGGTFVKSTDTGALAACGLGGSLFRTANRENVNRRDVMNKMKEIGAILRVPHEKVEDVKFMLERLLEGEWGQGRWIEVLVGACIYVAIRQSRLPLTLVEVASSVDCGIVELGRMYRRVLESLELELPETDPFVFMERAISSLALSKGIDRDLTRVMSKQGSLLLECSQQWFIITGRRPLPVVAAVLALVAEANQIKFDFDDVVREVYSHPRTSRMRLTELKEALVGVGQKLPWGKDITVKTLDKHLPFLLKFLESDMKRAKKKSCSVSLLPLPQRQHTRSPTKLESSYAQKGVESHKSNMQPSASDCISSAKGTSATGRQSGLFLEDGRSVELKLVEALKRKEVEWQAWPKSFLVGADAHCRRRGKIRAAMERIRLAKQGLLLRVDNNQPKSSLPVPSSDSKLRDAERSRAKRRKVDSGLSLQKIKRELDWEDLVIEYLLLRGVNHTQLEDGYYKAALGVHHMQSTDQIDDDELIPYLRSKAEVKMLRSLHDVGDANLLTPPV
ncbi:hypothetical protein KC19_1G153700 [Ceratodon purpureus]|uniref:Uncharacterized protein n=1 Tax=Ceratodon purpureus TaxID=3225 RepID=A0A8T0J8H9_CERPU|nr:hypothetical protein KC19_1G153700 [Ceratodon purpureus]